MLCANKVPNSKDGKVFSLVDTVHSTNLLTYLLSQALLFCDVSFTNKNKQSKSWKLSEIYRTAKYISDKAGCNNFD